VKGISEVLGQLGDLMVGDVILQIDGRLLEVLDNDVIINTFRDAARDGATLPVARVDGVVG